MPCKYGGSPQEITPKLWEEATWQYKNSIVTGSCAMSCASVMTAIWGYEAGGLQVQDQPGQRNKGLSQNKI